MTNRSVRGNDKHIGYTIEQLAEHDTEMGLKYERFVGQRVLHQSDARAALVFARGACRVAVSIKSSRSKFELTSTQLLYAPPGTLIEIVSKSTVFDVLILLPSAAYSEAMVVENHLDGNALAALATCHYRLQRSRWIDDLVERYFFERVVNKSTPAGCPFFLEKQMLNELVRLIFKGIIPTTGRMLADEPSNLALDALQFIEANLFQKIEIETVCKHTKCSQPTLTREFKRLFGKTPGAYIKERQLDEAAIMIERNDYRIGDVCMLIGYDDIGSFSRAFKERFAVSPKGYRDTRKLLAQSDQPAVAK